MELALSTDLIEFKSANALDVFTTPAEIDKIVDLLRDKTKDFKGDVSTDGGRQEVKTMAWRVTKSRTAIKAIGDDLAKEAKSLPAKIDAGRRRFNEEIEKIEISIRQPLTEWEAADKKRQQDHLDAIAKLKNLCSDLEGLNAVELRAYLALAQAEPVGPQCEEFEEGYRFAKKCAVEKLAAAVDARVKYEVDQAELARLRAESDKRLAEEREANRVKEQAERERKIAEKAAQDAIAAEAKARADLERQVEETKAKAARDAEAAERKFNEERAAADRKLAEERQKTERERQAEEDRQSNLAAEALRRETNRKHCGRVNREVRDALVKGCLIVNLSEEQAEEVVKAIALKLIPCVRIEY